MNPHQLNEKIDRLESEVAALKKASEQSGRSPARPSTGSGRSKSIFLILIALFFSTAIVLYAIPNTFTSGDLVSSSQLNENFTDLETRIATLENGLTNRVVFVLGSTCPEGYTAPNEDWSSRFLLFSTDSSNTASPTSAGTYQSGQAAYGGSSVISVAQMPTHSHTVSMPKCCRFGNPSGGNCDAGCGYDPVGTTNAGSSNPYWQPFVKLKPCVKT